MIPKQNIPNIFIDMSIKTSIEDLKHLVIERKDFLESKIKQMCFIFGGKEIKDVHSPLTNIMKKKDCLTMTLLPIRGPTSSNMSPRKTSPSSTDPVAKFMEKGETIFVRGEDGILRRKSDLKKKKVNELEVAKINELDKDKIEKKKDEAKINELEKKKKDKDVMKEKSIEAKKYEAAKINELDKKDDDERKNFSDIFGYVDKKSMDIILNHVENELGAVDGKLLCCYVTIER